MTERLVDVLRGQEHILHTFPVTISDPKVASNDAAYQAKAVDAAALAHLVPNAQLNSLTSRMHVSRAGRLEPFGDNRPVTLQTQDGIDQAIRERAYLLWRQDGSPSGYAEEYWHCAREQHLREGAYILWHLDGCPDGRANDHWHRSETFNPHDQSTR